jgi:hypothetical protein
LVPDQILAKQHLFHEFGVNLGFNVDQFNSRIFSDIHSKHIIHFLWIYLHQFPHSTVQLRLAAEHYNNSTSAMFAISIPTVLQFQVYPAQ